MKKIQIMVFFVLLSLFPLQHIAEESVLIQEPISFTESFGNPLYSQVSGARRFTYYASDNDAFKILIERNSGEMWETESISAPLYSWNGINPSLDVIHENMFYIKFDDRAYAEIMHDDSRGWSLRLWAVFSGGSTFFAFYPNALCINKYSAGNASSQWIYGSALISFDLDSLDVSKLPTDDSDILKLIDPSHWAVILTHVEPYGNGYRVSIAQGNTNGTYNSDSYDIIDYTPSPSATNPQLYNDRFNSKLVGFGIGIGRG